MSARHTALAATAMTPIRWPSSARSARSDAISSLVAVTSTVRKVVTCGAVKALRTIASAVCLRTPRIGMRVVRSPRRPVARSTSGTAPAVRGTLDARAAYDSTSARVIRPVAPLASTSARSTPSSFASLRTGGVERGRSRERLDRLVRVDHVVGRGLEHRGVDADRRSRAAAGPPLRATRAARRGSVADEVRLGLLFRCVLRRSVATSAGFAVGRQAASVS